MKKLKLLRYTLIFFLIFSIIQNTLCVEKTSEFKSIPAAFYTIETGPDRFYPITPDVKWHKKQYETINDSHKIIEKLCGTNSYNIANFQIRCFFQSKINNEIKNTFYSPNILYLSKMNMECLRININKNMGSNIQYGDNNELLILLKKNRQFYPECSSIRCFGDFFKAQDRMTYTTKAKQFLSELFDFEELNKRDDPEYSRNYNLRDDLSKRFVGSLTDEVKQRVYKGSELRIWMAFQDMLKDFYSNSLYGILPFDEESNKIARKYFKGESATNAFLKFEDNFADSEQAIYQYLLYLNDQEIDAIKPKENNYILKHILIDIISYRPICKYCEGTALRYIDKDIIGESIKRKLNISEDSKINVSFQVSYVNRD